MLNLLRINFSTSFALVVTTALRQYVLSVFLTTSFLTHGACFYFSVQAYNICTERDLVPEMVFLLGRMGNNKKALYLIIDRLGDVSRVRDMPSSVFL